MDVIFMAISIVGLGMLVAIATILSSLNQNLRYIKNNLKFLCGEVARSYKEAK